MSHRRLAVALFVLGSCLILPVTARAQSAIAGVVRDTSGAVLPGVTVEASSPALIERVKSAVSNESGQYRIVDLRPGTYTVTYTLTGFSTVRRDGIELEANFTAPISVEMRVGTLEESIVVTGESPIVDVQSSQRREVVTQTQIETIPTGRNFQLMAALVPAVSAGVFDVGGSSAMWTGGSLVVHGSLNADSRTMIDGMAVDAMFGGGQCSCTYDNEAQTQEMAVQVSGGSAENQLSGVLVNRIPKTGGNTFSGDFVSLFANDRLQSQNLDDDIRSRGLTTPAHLHRLYDINFSLGGPIIRDRLWFFFSGRHWAYNNFVANAFNADGSQAVDDNELKAYPLRLTAQLTQRNRVTALFDWASKNRGHRTLSATVTPEASFTQKSPAQHIGQAKWTSTMSDRLLVEAGYTQTYNAQKYGYQPDLARATCFTAFAACASGTSYGAIGKQDTLLGTFWNAAASGPGTTAPSFQPSMSHVVIGSLAYVTGAHNFKVGFQNRSGYERDIRSGVHGDLRQQYRNGVPFAVVTFNTPIDRRTNVNADFGVYVQDTWTMDRLTINPGLRYDYFSSEVPEQTSPAGRFVPERHFDRVEMPTWHNVSPRFGASYDLFGNGKTAIKGTIGLYVQSQGTGFASTYNPVSFAQATRTWNDLNGDDIAQEIEMGPTPNLGFGVRRNRNPDPGIERPYQRVADLGIQHELLPGLGISVSYNERSFHNITWTDNLAISHSDYTLIMVPDPRGNGQMLPVYNLNPAKFGLVEELDTNSTERTRVYRGVDASFNLRMRNGATVFGGTSTGHTTQVTCEVEDPNSLRFCDDTQHNNPFRTSFKLAGSYPLPYDVRVGANFQSTPGGDRAITYQVTRGLVPTLTQTSVSVTLNDPNTLFNDRINQLDVTISRTFRANGSVQIRPEAGLFNLLNANPVLGITNTFGPALDRVNSILDPRLVRLGLTVRF